MLWQSFLECKGLNFNFALRYGKYAFRGRMRYTLGVEKWWKWDKATAKGTARERRSVFDWPKFSGSKTRRRSCRNGSFGRDNGGGFLEQPRGHFRTIEGKLRRRLFGSLTKKLKSRRNRVRHRENVPSILGFKPDPRESWFENAIPRQTAVNRVNRPMTRGNIIAIRIDSDVYRERWNLGDVPRSARFVRAAPFRLTYCTCDKNTLDKITPRRCRCNCRA